MFHRTWPSARSRRRSTHRMQCPHRQHVQPTGEIHLLVVTSISVRQAWGRSRKPSAAPGRFKCRSSSPFSFDLLGLELRFLQPSFHFFANAPVPPLSFHSTGARPLYDQVSIVDNVLFCGVLPANEVTGGLHEVGSRSLEESPQGSVARTSRRSTTTKNYHRA